MVKAEEIFKQEVIKKSSGMDPNRKKKKKSGRTSQKVTEKRCNGGMPPCYARKKIKEIKKKKMKLGTEKDGQTTFGLEKMNK